MSENELPGHISFIDLQKRQHTYPSGRICGVVVAPVKLNRHPIYHSAIHVGTNKSLFNQDISFMSIGVSHDTATRVRKEWLALQKQAHPLPARVRLSSRAAIYGGHTGTVTRRLKASGRLYVVLDRKTYDGRPLFYAAREDEIDEWLDGESEEKENEDVEGGNAHDADCDTG